MFYIECLLALLMIIDLFSFYSLLDNKMWLASIMKYMKWSRPSTEKAEPFALTEPPAPAKLEPQRFPTPQEISLSKLDERLQPYKRAR